MARPPVPVGSHGKISITAVEGGYKAHTRVRDADGVYREVERGGRTQAKAEYNLKEAIQLRGTAARGNGVTPASKMRFAGDTWLKGIEESVTQGQLEAGTLDQYRRNFDRYVAPGLGELRIKEIDVPRLDAFIQEVRLHHGNATARLARTVISGILGLATRHGALPSNPTREVGRIGSRHRKRPRALTLDERTAWLAQLEADKQAVRKDLPDLCCWMLATGVRIGEALAVSWQEIDLDVATVDIDWTLTRVRGAGLLRKSTKTESGERTLPLPDFAIEMLKRRAERGVRDTSPLFPDARGGWRDPSNTRRDLRRARGTDGFAWVTSHVFRKTCATILDDAGLSPRLVANQLGHARPSLTQDLYMSRTAVSRAGAEALDRSWALQSAPQPSGESAE